MTGVCCVICPDVARLFGAGRRVDDVLDFCALDPATLAARLRAHGHTALAGRIAPAPRTTTAAPVQGVLALGRTA